MVDHAAAALERSRVATVGAPQQLVPTVPAALLHSQLQALVDSCLADDPEERPSAQEVLELLSAMLSNEI